MRVCHDNSIAWREKRPASRDVQWNSVKRSSFLVPVDVCNAFLSKKSVRPKQSIDWRTILGLGTLTGRTIFRNHPETSTTTQERPKAFISSAAAALNAWPHETYPSSGIPQAPWDWFLALKNKNHLPHLLGVSSEMSKIWNKITLQLDMQIIIIFSQPDPFSDPHPHIPNPFQPSFSWQVQLGIPWNPGAFGATPPVPSWHVVQYPVLVPHRSAMWRSGGYWDTSTARSWRVKSWLQPRKKRKTISFVSFQQKTKRWCRFKEWQNAMRICAKLLQIS